MVRKTVQGALAEGRHLLFEHELLAVFEQLGCPVPWYRFLPIESLDEPAISRRLLGQPGVLKVVSPAILHKTDVGGVRFIDNVSAEHVTAHARSILDGLCSDLRLTVRGFLLQERIPYQPDVGREILVCHPSCLR